MLAFLFPGQGSQYRGMGQAMFDASPEYARVEGEIDRRLGWSVRALCLDGPDARLKDTRFTQPCLFVVNALHYWQALRTHGRPDALAGHSVGEYSALMAAGAFDLLTGVQLVAARAEAMASAPPGAMAAVLKMSGSEVEQALHESGCADIDIANYNTPQQTVIAGPAPSVARAVELFQRRASCVPLAVSGAFHSRYMTEAAARFGRVLEAVTFNPITVPVIANVTGDFYPDRRPATLRAMLQRQMTSPVLWFQGIRQLRRAGVSSFVETGPGGVLMRLCQQIDPQVPA
jgi:malonyl CoA-acyl carrier protein transacylase